jgi:heterodisulfide reductase subunit B
VEKEVKEHSKKVHFPYQGNIPIRYALDLFCDEPILEEVKKKRVKPLSGLKVACYYGCLTVRPPKVTGIREYENPQHMDRLMKCLGADPVPWSYKTDCCGASLVMTRTDIVRKLNERLLSMAMEAEVDCLATGCPMCQANLDTRQEELEKETGKKYNLPILYFTELMGLALGHRDTKKWLNRHITNPSKMLRAKGLM